MRRKTIGRNPLDGLPAVRPGKGRKARVLKLGDSAQREFREAILKRPKVRKPEGLLAWMGGALKRLAG